MSNLTVSSNQMARHDLANGNWRNCGSSSSSNAYSGVGSSTTDGNTYYRGLMNFDISSIPSTSTVSLAQLKVYVTGGSNTTAKGYYRTRLITKSWTSAKPSWGGGATSGNHTADYVGMEGVYLGITDSGYYRFDVTSIIQEWVKNPSKYYGIALTSFTESTNSSTGYVKDGYNKFASLKHIAGMGYSGGSAYYPVLAVEYTTPTIKFNGNQVTSIKFNGNAVTSLIYNGTKLF